MLQNLASITGIKHNRFESSNPAYWPLSIRTADPRQIKNMRAGILVFGYYAMLVWPKQRAEWPIWHEAKTGQGSPASPAQPVAWPAVAC